MIRAAVIFGALALAGPAQASDLELAGPLVQGGLIVGETAPGSFVYLDGREVRVDDQGRFVFGLGRDQGEEIRLWIIHPDGRQLTQRFAVAQRAYEIERLNGVPPRGAPPDDDLSRQIAAEAHRLAEVRAEDRESADYLSGWLQPVVGEVITPFGAQRVINGEPQPPHPGVDIAAPPDTPVVAAADGLVVLVGLNFHEGGGTVVIDHGGGITSSFHHLQDLDVEVGEAVERGERIGRLGDGGAHAQPQLDWRVHWFDRALDPMLLAATPQETN